LQRTREKCVRGGCDCAIRTGVREGEGTHPEVGVQSLEEVSLPAMRPLLAHADDPLLSGAPIPEHMKGGATDTQREPSLPREATNVPGAACIDGGCITWPVNAWL
jgi:hypothetical protein